MKFLWLGCSHHITRIMLYQVRVSTGNRQEPHHDSGGLRMLLMISCMIDVRALQTFVQTWQKVWVALFGI